MTGRARPGEPLADWCEARIVGVCRGRPEHRHHRLRRSQGGGDEPANTLDVCGRCHDWIHGHPAWAYQRGWLRHSWDVDDRCGACYQPSPVSLCAECIREQARAGEAW